jgi:TonB family protein
MNGAVDNTTLSLLSGPPKGSYNTPFGAIFALTLLAFIAAGLYLKTVKPLQVQEGPKAAKQIQTQFVLMEKKKPPAPKPKPAAPKADEPVDLTKAPLLNQKQDFTAPQAAPEDQPKQAARPVYGLRRVFSTGFGAGGSVSDAVIGKRGNTLDKDVDTVTATKRDLSGPLVSVSTVSTPPRLKNFVRPEYTKEMKDAKLEGVVRAELLIDIDGTVKQVKVLSDIGYGTKEMAIKAFMQWTFEPALRDKTPVAVWISYSIRFEFTE